MLLQRRREALLVAERSTAKPALIAAPHVMQALATEEAQPHPRRQGREAKAQGAHNAKAVHGATG